MNCPTITNLHAILAAYDAPAGPSKADTIKAVAECLSGACASATFDLHAAIMNIPADHAKACGTNNAPAYKIGHRDARHAAAELAIQAQPVAAQGGQDAERYRWLAERFTGYDFYWGGTPDADTEEGKGRIVIVFECGQQFRGGRDFASAIDAAILAAKGGSV